MRSGRTPGAVAGGAPVLVPRLTPRPGLSASDQAVLQWGTLRAADGHRAESFRVVGACDWMG